MSTTNLPLPLSDRSTRIVTAAYPGPGIRSVERPAEAPETPESTWLPYSQTTQTSRSVTAVGWTIDGTGVFGIQIPGPPRPLDQEDDPDQFAALFRIASLVMAGGALWSDMATSESAILGDPEGALDGFSDLPNDCRGWIRGPTTSTPSPTPRSSRW